MYMSDHGWSRRVTETCRASSQRQHQRLHPHCWHSGSLTAPFAQASAMALWSQASVPLTPRNFPFRLLCPTSTNPPSHPTTTHPNTKCEENARQTRKVECSYTRLTHAHIDRGGAYLLCWVPSMPLACLLGWGPSISHAAWHVAHAPQGHLSRPIVKTLLVHSFLLYLQLSKVHWRLLRPGTTAHRQTRRQAYTRHTYDTHQQVCDIYDTHQHIAWVRQGISITRTHDTHETHPHIALVCQGNSIISSDKCLWSEL